MASCCIRYKTGVDTYLNVFTAETSLLSNQQTGINLYVQQMTSSVQLVEALAAVGTLRNFHQKGCRKQVDRIDLTARPAQFVNLRDVTVVVAGRSRTGIAAFDMPQQQTAAARTSPSLSAC